MNEERIYLTDYIEKMRTAYKQARAGFEIYADALENEKAKWDKEKADIENVQKIKGSI